MFGRFITIPQLIAAAREAGFDFGSGNPVNLIHHYARIGLIPKAVRAKPESVVGHTVGCYPEEVAGRLLEIQNLRRQGWSTEKIKVSLDRPVPAVSFVEEKGTIYNKAKQVNQVEQVRQVKSGYRLNHLGLGLGATAVVLVSMLVTVLVAGTNNRDLVSGQVLAAQVASGSAYLEINADTVFNGKVNLPSTGNSFMINTNEDTNFLTVVGGVTLDQNLSKASSPTFANLTLAAGTLVLTSNTQTLTNKTLSGSSNTFSNIPNSALSNSKVTVTAGTNLSGGGDVSLGSSVTLNLKSDLSLSTLTVSGLSTLGSATISGTLGVGGEASLSGKLVLDSATAQINAVRNQNLQLGFQNTGQVQFFNSSNYIDSSGNMYLAGNVVSSGGISGFWKRASGALAPTNITDDVLIGAAATSSAKIVLSGTSGRVGIGVISPSYPLDVAGGINLSSGNVLSINGSQVLSASTLGSGVTTSSLTAVGTIGTGVWNGTAVGTQYGGTGQNWSAVAQGNIPYFNAAGTLATLSPGTANQILKTGGAAANPSWDNISSLVSGTSNQITVSGTQTITLSTPQDIHTAASPTFASLTLSGSATVSGGLTLYATPTIQSTSNQTLTLGGNTTGNIQLTPNNTATLLVGPSSLTQTGTATVSGTLGVGGEASFSAKLILGSATPQVNATNNRYLDLGFQNTGRVEFLNTSNYVDQNNDLYIGGSIISSGSQAGFWQRALGSVAPTNITDDVLVGHTATASAKVALSGTTGNVTAAGTVQMTGFKLTTGAASGFALISDGTGAGYWTDLSTSGTAGPWTLSNSTIFPDAASYKLLVGSVTVADGLGVITSSGKVTGKANTILNETGDQGVLTASISGIPAFLIDNKGLLSNPGTVYGLSGIPGSLGVNDLLAVAATSSAYPAVNIVATTGQAAMVLDQKDTGGDLFTASAAGIPKFVINKTGQIGVGTGAPAATALLDLTSTTLGFLGPRMTTTQRDAIGSPATGLMIYNTSTNQYNIYNGTSWGAVAVGSIVASQWQIDATNGLIVPYDVQQSFGVGSTATASAFFVVDGTTGFLSNPGTTKGLNNIPGSLSINDILSVAATSSAYPAFRLNATTGQAAAIINQADAGGDLFTASAAGIPKFVINKSGQVGIGTGAPGYALDIAGGVNLSTGNALSINGTSVLNATTLGSGVTASSLTSVGTLTTGTWNTTAIGTQYGGTGGNFSSTAQGNIWYFSAAGTVSALAPGVAGQFLKTGGAGANPSWDTVSGSSNWQRASGALAPLNITDSVIIGLTATPSGAITTGSIQLYGVNNLTPVASISAVSSVAALVVDNRVGDLFTASSSGLNRFVITQAGNVGIGTTGPNYKLDVNGVISTAQNTSYSPVTSENGFRWKLVDNGGISNDVGFGVDNPASAHGLAWLNLTANNAGLPYDFAVFAGVDGEKFRITSAGNVGIGATSPLGKLDVRGGNSTTPVATISGTSSFAAMVVDNSGVGDLFTASSSGLNRFVITQAGNVGIGTTNPQAALNIVGSEARIQNGSAFLSFYNAAGTTRTGYVQNNEGSSFIINQQQAGPMLLYTSGAEKVRIDSSGNVGIGTTAPGAKLDVSGAATVSGNLTFYGAARTIANTSMLSLTIGDSSTGNVTLSSGNLTRIQAGGTGTGNAGTGSIYFLSSAGSTAGRYEAPTPIAGDGSDGAITLSGSTNCTTTDISTADGDVTADCIASGISATASSNQANVTVSSASGFAAGDEVLIIQMTGTGIGGYEFRFISSIASNTLTLTNSLTNTYTNDGSSKAQVVRVPQYTTVTVNNGGTLTASAWNGAIGGVLAFRASTSVTVNSGGVIDGNALGFGGGVVDNAGSGSGGGATGGNSTIGNAGGGGGSYCGGGGSGAAAGGGGGGGGYGAAGTAGGAGGGGGAGGQNNGCNISIGAGGAATSGGSAGSAGSSYGAASLSSLYLGSGGGGGRNGTTGGGGGSGSNGLPGSGGSGGSGAAGGAGGGLVFIGTATLTNSGTIRANGAVGSNGSSGSAGGNGERNGGSGGGGSAGSGGGGGSGGSVWIRTTTAITVGTVTATGGSGGSGGANGGNGGTTNYIDIYPPNGGGDGGGGGGVTGGNAGTGAASSGDQNGGSSNHGGGAGAVGRIRCDTVDGTCSGPSPSPFTATTFVYGTFYLGGTNTSAADLAEMYVSGDKTISAGDVVSISNTKVLDDREQAVTNRGVLRKTEKAYDNKLIGIISTNPGVLMGSIDGETGRVDKRALALSGRVPVKIAPDSEQIEVGDFLTSSSAYPGMAMKATKAGYTVAKALENWTGQDTIDAFVSLGYNMSPIEATLASLTPDVTASIAALPKIRSDLDLLKEQMASVSGRLAHVDDRLSKVEDGTLKIDGESSTAAASIVNLLSSTPTIDLLSSTVNISTMSAQFGTFSDSLKVIGKTQLAETSIGGALSVGLLHFDDIKAEISSLTGELTVEGDLKVTGKLKLPNSSGKVTIVAGAKDVTLNVLGVATSSAVFATPEDRAVPVSAKSTESGRLTIQIPEVLPINLKVNWWITN